MSEPKKEKRSRGSIEKKYKKSGVEKKKRAKKQEDQQKAVATTLSLLAEEGAIDPALSSLFAAKVSTTTSQ